MEFLKVFDTIPEQFDKYRPRHSAELFADLEPIVNWNNHIGVSLSDAVYFGDDNDDIEPIKNCAQPSL